MSDQTTYHDVVLATGATLRVQAVTPHAFRLRVRPDGEFPEPGLVRYGILAPLPPVEVSVEETAEAVLFTTGAARLKVDRREGRMALYDAEGHVLLEQVEAPVSDPQTGFSTSFGLADGVRLYGLGDETRDRIQKRGHKTQMVLRDIVRYVPIPFVMSTGGWAVFMNSTWFHHVDLGATLPDRLVFHGRRGDLDFFVIAGATLPELLDRYTQISGRPVLLPQWGYGLTYVCDDRGVRARDVLIEAREFRQEGIPLDLIGLEPEWMETYYDFSVNKQWSPERFHQPAWVPHQKPGGFTAALRNMGYKLSLWLCCDYDVTEYEEQLLGAGSASGTTGETEAPQLGEDRYEEAVIKDPHFVTRYQDQITRLGEPWFEHLKKFVDNGAEAFKMDGANQICFHPDRKWRNGMDDEEVHNLYPVLLAKQMAHGFRDYTGRRAMIYTAGGYAGTQQYAATWAGDTGGGEKPLVSLLNHALSGHSNTSCDMEIWDPQGLHFGFLQPWSQVLGWHQYNQPWYLSTENYEMFKFYAKLRYRLLPYLYSMAHIAARTGMPVVRPMPLVMLDDPRCDELLGQYMLGESLLTAAFTDRVVLPPGCWIDYWTGETHEGGCELRYTPPPGRGGPLFVKAGAIIPLGPEMDFVGQIPLETLQLEIYPWQRSEFTLYEDDGETYAYLQDEVATTTITCETGSGGIAITIPPRQGRYAGMPERREWELLVHLSDPGERVTVNGTARQGEYQEGIMRLRV